MDRIVKLLIAQIGFIFLGVILAAIPCFLIMGMDIAVFRKFASYMVYVVKEIRSFRLTDLVIPFCESNHSDYYAECLVFLLCEWTGWFVQFPGV